MFRASALLLMGEWRNGRRNSLKNCYSKECVGSSPISPTVMGAPKLLVTMA